MGVDPETGRQTWLFNPRRDRWKEHFAWSSDRVIIIGRTDIGRATIAALDMNALRLLHLRQLWIRLRLHPPSELD